MKTCTRCGETYPANRTKDSGFVYRKDRGTYEASCKRCRRIAQRGRTRDIKTREAEAIERDPHGHLAVDIIIQAIDDWRIEPTDELRAFFASKWFETLSDLASDVDADFIRRHVLANTEGVDDD